MDLIEISSYRDSNFGYKCCLNVIDCFSKMVFSFPLKSIICAEICDNLQVCFILLATSNGSFEWKIFQIDF